VHSQNKCHDFLHPTECDATGAKRTTPGNNGIARLSIIVIVSSDNFSGPKAAFLE
jgi:hypothetical protein